MRARKKGGALSLELNARTFALLLALVADGSRIQPSVRAWFHGRPPPRSALRGRLGRQFSE